jgi:hypothetical protein
MNQQWLYKYKLYLFAVCFSIIIVHPSFSIANPSISKASGDIIDGQNLSLFGSGFGNHSLKIENLHEIIENGSLGQRLNRTGWDANWDRDWQGPVYANDSYHSGTKSLKSNVNTSLNWNSIFSYDMTNVLAGQKFYASWWVKYSGVNSVQWKMFRASGNKTIVDGSQEAVLFNWLQGSRQLVIDPGQSNDQTFWPSSSLYPGGDNKWYRLDLDFQASDTNQSNGTMKVTRYTDGGTINSQIFKNVKTHLKSGDNWGYAIWQNYIGNGSGQATIWFDDVYIQYNTSARVELCNGSQWSGRGKCEIQEPTAWSDNSISAVVNTGSYKNGQEVYIYVIDSNGNVNAQGFPIVIGGSRGTPSTPPEEDAPNPPTGLRVLE